ncbi:MAG: hypothetical protein C0623_01415 [Desulfuromonas sp.]|nr:MAG: hypothetical protein C0623_01415 [Desulfuromonas sp.]
MKNKDVIVTIICEITGRPAVEAERMAEEMLALNPATFLDLEQEISETDAAFLLNELRKRKDGIRLTLIESGMIVLSGEGTA